MSNNTKLLTWVHKNLSNSETIFPSLEDWKKSLYMLEELSKSRNLEKNYLRKMQMDALLASICTNRNYTIITQDSDFYTLQNGIHGNKLKIYNPNFV